MPTTARDAESSHAEKLSLLSFPLPFCYLSFFFLKLVHFQNSQEDKTSYERIEKSSHRVIDGRNQIYAQVNDLHLRIATIYNKLRFST